MANPQAVIALCTTLLALAGCDGSSADIDKVLSQLTGKLDQQSQDLAATRVHTDAELAELRKTYSALALIHSQPSVEALEALVEEDATKVQEAVPEPSMASSEASSEPTYTWEFDKYAHEAGYVCQPVFRQISCLDDGRPVYLDGSMNQLPFGQKP